MDSPDVLLDDGNVAHYRGGVVHAKCDGTTTLRLHHDGLFCSATLEVSAHPSGSVSQVLTGLPPVAGVACIGDELVISTRRSALYSVKDGKYVLLTSVPLQPPTFGGTDTIATAPNGDLAVRVTDRSGVFVLRADHQYSRSSLVELPEQRPITSMTWAGLNLLVGTNTGAIWQINDDGDQTKLTDVGGHVVALTADDETVYAAVGTTSRRLLRFPMATPQQLEDLVDPGTLPTDILAADGVLFLTNFQDGRVLALRDSTLHEVATGLSNPTSLARTSDGTLYVAQLEPGAVARILP